MENNNIIISTQPAYTTVTTYSYVNTTNEPEIVVKDEHKDVVTYNRTTIYFGGNRSYSQPVKEYTPKPKRLPSKPNFPDIQTNNVKTINMQKIDTIVDDIIVPEKPIREPIKPNMPDIETNNVSTIFTGTYRENLETPKDFDTTYGINYDYSFLYNDESLIDLKYNHTGIIKECDDHGLLIDDDMYLLFHDKNFVYTRPEITTRNVSYIYIHPNIPDYTPKEKVSYMYGSYNIENVKRTSYSYMDGLKRYSYETIYSYTDNISYITYTCNGNVCYVTFDNGSKYLHEIRYSPKTANKIVLLSNSYYNNAYILSNSYNINTYYSYDINTYNTKVYDNKLNAYINVACTYSVSQPIICKRIKFDRQPSIPKSRLLMEKLKPFLTYEQAFAYEYETTYGIASAYAYYINYAAYTYTQELSEYIEHKNNLNTVIKYFVENNIKWPYITYLSYAACIAYLCPNTDLLNTKQIGISLNTNISL